LFPGRVSLSSSFTVLHDTLITVGAFSLTNTDISLTVQWLSVLLDDLGYVYRRPKHDLTHLQNAQAKQQALELLDELKKGATTMLSNSSLWMKLP